MQTKDYTKLLGSDSKSYRLIVPEVAAEASQIMFDLFNASTQNNVVLVKAIYVIPKGDVAVTGVVAIKLDILCTQSIGTGGTTALLNTEQVATTAIQDLSGGFGWSDRWHMEGITARKEPTGGCSANQALGYAYAFSEETNAALYALQNQDILRTPVILPTGRGICVKQGSVLSVNSYGFIVDFDVY